MDHSPHSTLLRALWTHGSFVVPGDADRRVPGRIRSGIHEAEAGAERHEQHQRNREPTGRQVASRIHDGACLVQISKLCRSVVFT